MDEQKKLYYFLVYYTYSLVSNNSGIGHGNVSVNSNKPMFTHAEIEHLIKKYDGTIKNITITGFNELTEEQYLIYIGEK